ncbi:MAG: hypothetical protein LUG18_09410 [Candidatus Azobacteroides sp.]|nr:hypothetical protein [Candidatus Azobacteroides sp.]
MNGRNALKRLLTMKKSYYPIFLLGMCFISNSIDAQPTKFPTNEELVAYFKKTEYPYPQNEYYKSFLHEFDAYITAPKLDLDQSPGFKELCNHFIKIPSAEELEPIIVEKIHFKLFRDDFTYHHIKCKSDNKTHLFLITGAGRIIHQSDNCNACKNIGTKRVQFKKQIIEYIAYLKEKYGNLENALDELAIPYDVKEKQRLLEQARADSIRAVKIELEKANQARKKRRTDSIKARVDSLRNTYKLVVRDSKVPNYIIQAGKDKIVINDLKVWGIMPTDRIARIFVYESDDEIFISTYPDFFLNEQEKAPYNYGYIEHDFYFGMLKYKESKSVLYKFPKNQKVIIKRNYQSANKKDKTKIYENKPK